MRNHGTPHPRPVGRWEVAVSPPASGSGGRSVRFPFLHGLRPSQPVDIRGQAIQVHTVGTVALSWQGESKRQTPLPNALRPVRQTRQCATQLNSKNLIFLAQARILM